MSVTYALRQAQCVVNWDKTATKFPGNPISSQTQPDHALPPPQTAPLERAPRHEGRSYAAHRAHRPPRRLYPAPPVADALPRNREPGRCWSEHGPASCGGPNEQSRPHIFVVHLDCPCCPSPAAPLTSPTPAPPRKPFLCGDLHAAEFTTRAGPHWPACRRLAVSKQALPWSSVAAI